MTEPDFRALIPGSETMVGPFEDERKARNEWLRLTCSPGTDPATTRYSIADGDDALGCRTRPPEKGRGSLASRALSNSAREAAGLDRHLAVRRTVGISCGGMLLVALATLTLQPAADARVPICAARRAANCAAPARTNFASYFSSDDYPAAARRNQEEGTVGIVVSVNAEGGVESCFIAASTNSSTLDEETCRIIRRRAHFTPAIHASGRPAADFVSARIRWQLGTPPSPAPGQAEAQTIDPVDVVIPSERLRPDFYSPYIRARPLASLSALVTYRDYPAGAPRGPDLRPTNFRLTIGPDGNVDDCVISVPQRVPRAGCDHLPADAGTGAISVRPASGPATRFPTTIRGRSIGAIASGRRSCRRPLPGGNNKRAREALPPAPFPMSLAEAASA